MIARRSVTAAAAVLLTAILLFAGCSRDPLLPASGEFVFQDTWGKDYYGTSRDIGPGHGDGTAGSEIGAFNAPSALAVWQSGLLVLDSGNHRIQKFSVSAADAGAPAVFSDQAADEVTLSSLGRDGTEVSRFLAPSDLCVLPSGGIAVADGENFCVQVFNPSGSLKGRIARILNSRPAGTNAPGGFMRPAGVAADSAGNLYVLDTFKSTVDKFSNSLAIDTSWGTGGSLADPALASAVDIEVDSGFLFVLYPTGIMKFGPSGGLVERKDLPGFGPDRLSAARKLSVCGEMLAVCDGDYVKFFDGEMEFLFSIGGLSGDRPGEFSLPSGAAMTGDELYVADSGNNRIQVLTRR